MYVLCGYLNITAAHVTTIPDMLMQYSCPFCAPFILHIMFAIVIRDLPDSLDGVDGEPDVGLRPVASGALGNEPSRGNKATGLS